MAKESPELNQPAQSQRPPLGRKLDLRVYVLLLLRWWWVILLAGIIAAAVAFSYNSRLTPIYQATSKVLINQARSPAGTDYSDILTSERIARTYADLMVRETTLQRTLTRLGVDPALAKEEIRSVDVTPVRDTQNVQVTVTGPTPELITAVANLLPQVFLEELRQVQASNFADSKQSLQTQLDELTQQIDSSRLRLTELENRRTPQAEVEIGRLNNALLQFQTSYANLLQSYEAIRLAEAQSTDNIVLMEPATTPTAPVQPRVLFNTLLATLAAIFAGLGILFLIEYLDDRVQTPEDLRMIADLPVVGTIGVLPTDDGQQAALPISITQPRHPTVESYRHLRTNLKFYSVDRKMNALVVSSAEAGEGKSMTTANLAIVMAQADLKVVLVDGDLRRPTQHRIFGLRRAPGLAEALVESIELETLLQQAPEAPNLWLLPAGATAPNPAELLGSQRMETLHQQLLATADMVIYDTPPLLAVTDARLLGRLTSGALLVVNAQRTRADAVRRALQSLAQVRVPLLGVTLNRIPNTGRGYYYYYYSNQYYGTDGKRRGLRWPLGGGKQRHHTRNGAPPVSAPAPSGPPSGR
jgi:capsular exopolysaccharide synthesis family protein